MSDSTPYVSTAPLDMLAITMTLACMLNALMIFAVVFTVLSSLYGVDVYFNRQGYNLLIVQQRPQPHGYGVTFDQGLRVWKYLRQPDGERNGTQIFP